MKNLPKKHLHVLVTEAQYKYLKRSAVKQHVSLAQVVRNVISFCELEERKKRTKSKK